MALVKDVRCAIFGGVEAAALQNLIHRIVGNFKTIRFLSASALFLPFLKNPARTVLFSRSKWQKQKHKQPLR
jgi:hypothetical protein